MIMRVPEPRPTAVYINSKKKSKTVRCLVCGEIVSWVTSELERKHPARSRALLGAHHLTDEECRQATEGPS